MPDRLPELDQLLREMSDAELAKASRAHAGQPGRLALPVLSGPPPPPQGGQFSTVKGVSLSPARTTDGLVDPVVLVVGSDELPDDVDLALLDRLANRECGAHPIPEADRPDVVTLEFVQPKSPRRLRWIKPMLGQPRNEQRLGAEKGFPRRPGQPVVLPHEASGPTLRESARRARSLTRSEDSVRDEP